jgi:2-isopropylmalate synthase
MNKQALRIYDTTLRDGSQALDINFTVDEKVQLIKELDDFGMNYIEAGWPRAGSLDETVFRKASKLKLKNAKLAAFGATKKHGVKVAEDPLINALIESKAQVVTIFGKTWIAHVTYQLKTTPEENLQLIFQTVSYLKNNELHKFEEVIYDAEHFFDGYKSDPDYALKTVKYAILGGADIIVPCDTNGGSLPWEIGEIIGDLKRYVEKDSEIVNSLRGRRIELGIHCHNDSELAVANSLEAVRNGVTHIQGTINGVGERIGNTNLCSILANIGLKTKYKLPKAIKLERLTEMSNTFQRVAGQRRKLDTPFVGAKAFAHDGGVHVDAVLKGASYHHIDPRQVGNKMRIVLSTNSGKASVYGVVKSLGFNVEKDDPRLMEMLKEVHRLCAEGYDLSILDDEHYLLALRYFGNITHKIRINRCDVTSHFTDVDGKIEHDNSCILKMDVDGKEYKIFEDTENGPVGVNFKAIKEALKKANLPTNFELVNYEVGLPKVRAGAGSKIQTYITYEDDKGRRIITSGFHEDIIASSRESLLKASLLIAGKARKNGKNKTKK